MSRFLAAADKVRPPALAMAVGTRLPYLPGLDGLRALAVVAVLLYHAGARWLPGGFLGVEVFFVISGYLITSLLLAEWQARGGVDLKAFWLRRARRLLPAAFLLILSTLAFAVLFLPAEVAGLRGDALASFAYLTNWYLVLDQQSYFEAVGRPSPLRHLWSLAVEEQFYLLWPLAFAVGTLRWGRRRLLLGVLAGAAASTAWMVVLYRPDVDPSRLYYGTDTRAAGLLLGVALAYVWAPARRSPALPPTRLAPDLVGLPALGGLGLLFLHLGECQPFLYQGGFLAVALATAVVIAVVVHPRSRLVPRLLGWRPLRWLGLRSYSIYLWHWPVFVFTRPQIDVPLDGPALLAFRLGLTLTLAQLSYRYVETPIRCGALGRSLAVRRGRLGVRWAATALTVGLCSVLIGVSVADAQPPAPPSYLAVESVDTVGTVATPPRPTATASPTATTTATASPRAATPTPTGLPARSTPGVPPPSAAPPTATPAPATPTATHPQRRPAITGRVIAIGDSVLIGAAEEIQKALGQVGIDAAQGRQVQAIIETLRARRAAGQLGEVVVVQAGNNGTLSAKQFDEMMALLADVRLVVFVNVKVPRPWEAPNNKVLAEGVQRYPNAVLADWHAASAGHPELFWDDGIHLRPEGAKAYAVLVAEALATPRPPTADAEARVAVGELCPPTRGEVRS